MKKRLLVVLTIAGLVCSLPAFAHEADDVEADLQKPIDCDTAEGDIRVLEGEKKHVASQVLNGVTAIAPAGIVFGLITGTEKKKLKVASGDYNKMITQRIAEIKDQCGIE